MKKIENFELQFVPMKQDELNTCNGGYYQTCLGPIPHAELLLWFQKTMDQQWAYQR